MICNDERFKIKKDTRLATDGAKLLYNMVYSHYNNLPIFTIHPESALSTDSTVNYIFKGNEKGEDTFRLVTTKAQQKTGIRSKYKAKSLKHMSEMRVKLTYKFSAAAGTMTPF